MKRLIALALAILILAISLAGCTSREEPTPTPEVRDSRLLYRLSALALTAFNLFLGLFSWTVADLIRQGLAMFG